MFVIQQVTPYAIITCAASFFSLWMAFYAWKRRHIAGVLELMLMITAAGTWAFFYSLELMSAQLALQIAFAKLEYFGIALISPAWFLFALSYSGKRQRIRRLWQNALWLIPALTIALVTTNESHHLIWQRAKQINVGQHLYLHLQHGAYFFVQTIYNYVLLLAGTLLLIHVAKHHFNKNRTQSIILFIGILPAWIANFLYLARISPWPYLDLTILGIIFTSFIMIYGLYYRDLTNLLPLAAETILETIGDGILVVNAAGIVLNINRAAARMLDLSQQKADGLHISTLLPEHAIEQIEHSGHYEIRINNRYLKIHKSPLRAHHGYKLLYIQDITQLQENALRQERQNHYLKLLNRITHIILSKDDEDEILPELVKQVADLFQADEAIIIGQGKESPHAIILASTDEAFQDSKHLIKLMQTIGETNTIHVANDVQAIAPNCRLRSALILPLTANGIRMGSFIIGYATKKRFDQEMLFRGEQVAAQISLALSKIHLLQEVRRLAVIDDLTQAYNHRFLNITGQHIFTQALRYNEPLSIFLFDLDSFKAINDQYGHLTGDLVISQVARRCQNNIRRSDWLIRYGGDEFIVIMPHTHLETALTVAQRVHRAITQRPIATSHGPIQIKISLGLAELSKHVENLDTLIQHADTALYQAKEKGKNQIMVYQPA